MISVCHISEVRGPQPPHNSLPNPWYRYRYETWYRYNNPSIGIGIGMNSQPGIGIGIGIGMDSEPGIGIGIGIRVSI